MCDFIASCTHGAAWHMKRKNQTQNILKIPVDCSIDSRVLGSFFKLLFTRATYNATTVLLGVIMVNNNDDNKLAL